MPLTVITGTCKQQQGEAAPWSPVLRKAPEWFFALVDRDIVPASEEWPSLLSRIGFVYIRDSGIGTSFKIIILRISIFLGFKTLCVCLVCL